MNKQQFIERQLERLLGRGSVEPEAAFVARTRTIVLLHAAQTFPRQEKRWQRILAPFLLGTVACASAVIIVGQIQRSRLPEIDRIQSDLSQLTIQEE